MSKLNTAKCFDDSGKMNKLVSVHTARELVTVTYKNLIDPSDLADFRNETNPDRIIYLANLFCNTLQQTNQKLRSISSVVEESVDLEEYEIEPIIEKIQGAIETNVNNILDDLAGKRDITERIHALVEKQVITPLEASHALKYQNLFKDVLVEGSFPEVSDLFRQLKDRTTRSVVADALLQNTNVVANLTKTIEFFTKCDQWLHKVKSLTWLRVKKWLYNPSELRCNSNWRHDIAVLKKMVTIIKSSN